MAKKTIENLEEKGMTKSQSSKLKREVSEELFSSIDFYWCLAMGGIDFFVDHIKNYKGMPSEFADLLLGVSSCDSARINAYDMINEEEMNEDSFFEKDSNGKIKNIYKYEGIKRNELSVNEEKERTIAFLLMPWKEERYIATVAKNMESFTKISVKGLKVLNDAGYGKEVSEYVRKNKKYVKKS